MSARSGVSWRWLVLAVAAVGCAERAKPYAFRAPVVGAVRAAELPPRAPERTTPAVITEMRGAEIPPAPPVPRPTSRAVTRVDATGPAARLRDLVGARDPDSTHVELALQGLEEVTGAVPPALRGLDSGPALVATARERGAFDREGPPTPGDLVVFDGVVAGRPASLVGVVLSVDARGTVAFVHLTRGVVRRGFLNPRRPSTQRDGDGRILNTFVRHLRGAAPRGAEFLAGELFAGYVRASELSQLR